MKERGRASVGAPHKAGTAALAVALRDFAPRPEHAAARSAFSHRSS